MQRPPPTHQQMAYHQQPNFSPNNQPPNSQFNRPMMSGPPPSRPQQSSLQYNQQQQGGMKMPSVGMPVSGPPPMANGYPSRNGTISPHNTLLNQSQQHQQMSQQMNNMQINQPPMSQSNTFSQHQPMVQHSQIRGTGPPTNQPPMHSVRPQTHPPSSLAGPPNVLRTGPPTGPPTRPSIGPPSGFPSYDPTNPMSRPPALTRPMSPNSAMSQSDPRKPMYPQPGYHSQPPPTSQMMQPPISNMAGSPPPSFAPMRPTMGHGPGMSQPMGTPPVMGGSNMSRQPQPMGQGPMAGPMGAPQKRIDPNQMPNPIQVMNDDQQSFNEMVFHTSTRGKVPPLVSTKCKILDDGNCSPRYMRSSVYSIPCNQDMLKESNIPMSIVCTPFAKIPLDEHQIRYVDHGVNGPVRCNRCKAYMNPFMQFIDGGRRFVCNICSHSNEVPQEYFSHLDHQGRRVDIYERPELCFGSYEFIATTDYCKDSKFPNPPAFIFMIDVSYQSVQQGMVKVLANELHTLLDNLPRDVGMDESLIKVGFVTYNKQLHFYNVKENLAQPQMMVVTDLEDPFVPLLDGFLVNYQESKAIVDSLLDMLPEIFTDTRETDVVLGPVVAAGLEALKSAGISGKLYIFHSSLPIAEAPGKLKNREDRKLLATDKEKNILTPNGNYYMNLARECVNNGVSIDMFLFPNSYVDVATIGLMVTQTGGQIYRYSYFKESTHGKQFICDLRKNFKREVGFDAIMRLRCSTGLRPVEFYGSFMMSNTTDVELASIDSDKAIAIEIKHDDKIPEDGVTFVQNALLYTSVSGQRRLRIHNLAFSTCAQLAELYRCCELDTTVNFLSKASLRQVLSSTPSSIKENLIQRCVQILACYRQHCATPSTSGQLILPECMKLLPLFVNSLMKSDVLAGGSEMSSDDRSFLMQACLSMTPAISSVFFYPRVFALHILDLDHDDDDGPDQLRCLGEKFEDSGVYLLENTISMFIWVGLQVDPRFLQDVFGVSGIGQLDIEMTQLPEIGTPLSIRIRKIIESIQDQRQRYLKLTVVRQRDKLEPWFKHYIVEDKGFHANQLSYVDFLCHVHKEIRNLLS